MATSPLAPLNANCQEDKRWKEEEEKSKRFNTVRNLWAMEGLRGLAFIA